MSKFSIIIKGELQVDFKWKFPLNGQEAKHEWNTAAITGDIAVWKL